MIQKMEHLGIAVRDLEAATDLFTKLLGQAPYKTERIDSEGVSTVFFDLNGVKIELLGSIANDSPVARFIEKRGEGIHHIAFQTDSISAETERLDAEGFRFAGSPRPGADSMMVHFLHPSSTQGVLVELCQPKSNNA